MFSQRSIPSVNEIQNDNDTEERPQATTALAFDYPVNTTEDSAPAVKGEGDTIMQIEQILKEEETIDKRKTEDLLEQMRLNADSAEVITPEIEIRPTNATPMPTNIEIEGRLSQSPSAPKSPRSPEEIVAKDANIDVESVKQIRSIVKTFDQSEIGVLLS